VGPQPLPVLAIAVGLALGALFVVRQRRLASPLLDIRLFGIRAIGATLLMYLLVGVVQSGNGLVLNQHLQLVEGYSAFATALWMVIPIAVAIGGVHLSTLLAKRTRPSFVLAGGLVVAAAGSVVLTRIDAAGGLVTLLLGLCVVMLGTSPIGVLSGQLVMQACPPEHAGSAGALNGTAGELSSALGIATFGSLVTAFYSGSVDVPAGVASQDSAAANDSIANAVAVAQRLPATAATDLLRVARHTFNAAVTDIAGICVVLFLGLAVLVVATLRTVPPIGSERTSEPDPTD
jgi:DHA2 family multidrug resistance protein-like MFS transporter